jgi:hypothetical protein
MPKGPLGRNWIVGPIGFRKAGIIYGGRCTDYVRFVDLAPTSANFVGLSDGAACEGVRALVIPQNFGALCLARGVVEGACRHSTCSKNQALA